MSSIKIKQIIIYLLLGMTSIGLWILISWITGAKEAWDSKYYFLYGLSSMMIISGLLGFITPVRPWRWGVALVVPQMLYVVFTNIGANLMPLGVILFVVFLTWCILCSYLGRVCRRAVARWRLRGGTSGVGISPAKP